ncbi:Rhs element Vgr protein [Yersinia frederiksenii]|nr:Rhs element Vgr protein [Yersinia frederiksenii]
MNLLSELTGATLNRYSLIIPSCFSPLDVEDFNGLEQISVLYHYTIQFTTLHPDLTAELFLNKPATLNMGIGDLLSPVTGKVVHGVITHFRRISGSRDQVKYEIIVEPFLVLLNKQFRTHRFFVNKSVPEVVEQILQEHGLKDWEYEFALKQSYPKREQINQYQESEVKNEKWSRHYRVYNTKNINIEPTLHIQQVVKIENSKNKDEPANMTIIYPDGTIGHERTRVPDYEKLLSMK